MIGFQGYEAQNEQLKAVSGCQERLRLYVDELIKELDGYHAAGLEMV
jgi:hypothetical protein